MKVFASIYIGSVEATMKVLEVKKGSGLQEIDNLKKPTDIISEILRYKKISQETADKLCKMLLDMKRIMGSYKVDGYKVYANSVLKQASNIYFILDQVKTKTGFEVEIISNSEQRFLGYQAIASMDGFAEIIKDSAVLVDIGGVSLQLTYFSNGKLITTQHLDLGIVSVGENLRKLDSMANPIEQMNEILNKELDVFKSLYLTGESLKYMIISGDLNAAFYTIDFLMQPLKMLHKAIANSLQPKKIITPGVTTCDGMAYDYCYNNGWLVAEHDFNEDVLSAAWTISKRYGSYQPHLKALEKLSGMIFDATKKYHGMSDKHRLMMQVIAILHDCGKYISIAEASSGSYTIIMSSEILGLSHKEREMIAYTVSYNRKPLENYEALSDKFTPEEYVIIVKLLAILKVANALDRSHKQKSKNVSMTVRDNNLNITIESQASMALEKGLFSEKADFFQQIFGIRPVLKEKRLDL